ncbi:hypothetical protein E4631_07785 [Hymenobacter sp. UV11]|uniref:hypothetical protein n=1 Tax=Hymenobacter sp. UV11 TaxID=1849735 RepID=UPI00105E7A73|nr:hypothetical protein [Hymenobacter sp. UV11]TDN36163.1 hypothetical protein A8B98_09495 [Hymenobacter sp. UV11]TFZ66863.1 hypothetical protein E4631_07785 [Hymenobacter sp. UV11]
MKKKNKKADKKKGALKGAAKSLKKISKGSLGKLSTTQKVLAGATLGALGVRYLVKKLGQPKVPAAANPDTTYLNDAALAEDNLTALEE